MESDSTSDAAPDSSLINKTLPDVLLREIFMSLPVSNRFVAPVCRRFRDLHAVVHGDKKNRTYEYSIHSDAALDMRLREEQQEEDAEEDTEEDRRQETSRIGAGSGRRDWVERGGLFDGTTCMAAAAGGQLRVLRWLRGRGCPWDWRTCSQAAKGGHFAVLRWAREQGCPWDEMTCYWAASHGHLGILRWAAGEGCPVNAAACLGAEYHGHREVLHWLQREGLGRDCVLLGNR
mmetsp:Transcript_18564/g.36984  ORF Transcript_18564/g.36984 Transcript_18564/m.36984 type:complete len:233 (-) Transcript_18564:40-738(-)